MPRHPSFAAVAVLHAVARGMRHGFDIIDATGLPGGTVYPALGRLERDGYLRSAWEAVEIARRENRPPRRYYRLTPSGRRLLAAELERYRALTPIAPAPAGRRG